MGLRGQPEPGRRLERGVRVRHRRGCWPDQIVIDLASDVYGDDPGGIAVWVAYIADGPILKGLALLAAGGIWSVSFHCPAHWVVGRAIGIRFTDYFFFFFLFFYGSPPPPPT